jgi:hypothetical protein
MLFDYMPVVDGRPAKQIKAQATDIEITLVKNADDSLELATVTALGDVFFDDENNQLSAHRMSYDHRTHQMEMQSDPNDFCYVNGIAVSYIQFNLKTGELKTDVSSPGSVNTPPR